MYHCEYCINRWYYIIRINILGIKSGLRNSNELSMMFQNLACPNPHRTTEKLRKCIIFTTSQIECMCHVTCALHCEHSNACVS